MSYTPEDAWEEEGYDRLVNEILSSNKDSIIESFVRERTSSFYEKNPKMTESASWLLCESKKLEKISPSASLVFSMAATEVTLRDIILKPVAYGLINDDSQCGLMAELLVRSRGAEKLLLGVLRNYGIPIEKRKRSRTSKKTLWEEISCCRDVRNHIVHVGHQASPEEATLSLKTAQFLLQIIYPFIRRKITG